MPEHFIFYSTDHLLTCTLGCAQCTGQCNFFWHCVYSLKDILRTTELILTLRVTKIDAFMVKYTGNITIPPGTLKADLNGCFSWVFIRAFCEYTQVCESHFQQSNFSTTFITGTWAFEKQSFFRFGGMLSCCCSLYEGAISCVFNSQHFSLFPFLDYLICLKILVTIFIKIKTCSDKKNNVQCTAPH